MPKCPKYHDTIPPACGDSGTLWWLSELDNRLTVIEESVKTLITVVEALIVVVEEDR